jgi:OHCU decarboxylase
MTLDQLNESAAETAFKAFLDCCGSRRWADGMTERRPYPSLTLLRVTAEDLWRSLNESDWLEAFAAHPKIGEKKSSAKWSAGEQSGMSGAPQETAAAISRMNEDYERRFGWIFIVCATGKSAEEIRQILTARLRNSREAELPIAASEQLRITNLRLAKLVAE